LKKKPVCADEPHEVATDEDLTRTATTDDAPSTSVQVTADEESVAMNPDTDQLGGASISDSASEHKPVHEPLHQRLKAMVCPSAPVDWESIFPQRRSRTFSDDRGQNPFTEEYVDNVNPGEPQILIRRWRPPQKPPRLQEPPNDESIAAKEPSVPRATSPPKPPRLEQLQPSVMV
jgi:hypothetical protein